MSLRRWHGSRTYLVLPLASSGPWAVSLPEKGPRGYKVGELWQARTREKAAELRWGQASRCDAHLGTRSQDLDISPGAEERGEQRGWGPGGGPAAHSAKTAPPSHQLPGSDPSLPGLQTPPAHLHAAFLSELSRSWGQAGGGRNRTHISGYSLTVCLTMTQPSRDRHHPI